MKEISGKYATAKVFTDNFDSVTSEQIQTICNQRFVSDSKIRIMPDTHAGAGSVIGLTMTIGRYVVPFMVGVDIGCFTGDTKISLLNGTCKSIKELTELGEPIYIYSMNEKGIVVPGKAIARKTRENAELMEVTISGGETIRCTPDHEFMMLDGNYKEARNLKPKDSLMPLYRTYQSRDGYEFSKARGRGRLTHNMVYEHFFGKLKKGYVVHHKNSDWFDNTPENLISMSPSEHSKLHRTMQCTFKEEDFQEKKNKTISERGFLYKSQETMNKKRDVAIRNITSYMQENPTHFKISVADNGKRGAKYLKEFNKKNNSTVYICDCGRKIKGKGGFARHQKVCTEVNNHKVLFTKALDYKSEVFCLTVEKYHNFALSAGVFVHNCGMYCVNLGKADIDLADLDKFIHKNVPSGFNNNVQEKTEFDLSKLKCLDSIKSTNYNLALGSLGGGNHFIEVNDDPLGGKRLVIHTGSRNLGKQVAEHYQNIAVDNANKIHANDKSVIIANLKEGADRYDLENRLKEMDSEYHKIPRELNCLEGTDKDDYIRDMMIVQDYARVNRETIFKTINGFLMADKPNSFHTVHNYISEKDGILRKGAVSANAGEVLIIPINMRDGSLMCVGKGNPDWNNSAPHGAGRLMGRKEAMRRLQMDDFEKSMDGIYTTSVNKSTLDESPMAYKPMQEIIDNIKDTVTVATVIKPIYNFKAGGD